MAGPGVRNLSNRAVNAMEFDNDTMVWDRRLTGCLSAHIAYRMYLATAPFSARAAAL